MIRVYELARELNLTIKELLEKIRDMDIPVKSHMTSLDDDTVAKIKAKILNNKIKIVPAKVIKIPVKSDSTGATDTAARIKAKILKNKTEVVTEGTNKKPILSDKAKKRMKGMGERLKNYRKSYPDKPDLAEATSANDRDQDKFLSELNNYVDDILNLIEQINKRCHYTSPKVSSPIQIPPYPKDMEKGLKSPAQDETSFRSFSSYIFQLIVDGHNSVMNDIAIISKSEFLGFSSSLLENIRIFRCDLHHLPIKAHNKRKLGRIYNEVCGKNFLDDPDSRMKFQLELLKRTAEVLEKELELVKEKISKLL